MTARVRLSAGRRKLSPPAALRELAPSDEDAAANDLRRSIFETAEKWKDEAQGLGETAWDEDSKTVLYIAGDWTDVGPIADDFLAIPGVEAFDYEQEAIPSGWWEAEIVWPENPAKWVSVSPAEREAALQAVIELASRPL